MNVLVINGGSSSLKYQLVDTATQKNLVKGRIEHIGEKGGVKDHATALQQVFDKLAKGQEVHAIGHRVVHGGEVFKKSTLATLETIGMVEKISHLAPLHNPVNLLGIRACMNLLPNVPNVMVFDTAFHSTIPPSAYLYAIPLNDSKNLGIRRYGFHGTSHNYVSRECAKLLGKPREELKIITCHLGNGCSIAAVKHGKSVETSMGFTPLEGLIMGTRSGDIDPAALQTLSKAHGSSIEETIDYLNKKSGILGLANINSNDMRDLEDSVGKGNQDAITAFDAYCHRIIKYIGAYAAVMGGVDAIAFAGGTGENMPILHDKVMKNLGFLGAKHFVVKTDEELEIANETAAVLTSSKK